MPVRYNYYTMTTNKFEELLEEKIDMEIAKALPFCSKDLYHDIETLINGGRKFRSLLFYNTSKCFGYDDEEVLLDVATALEILHRASLIHDDITDQSQFRGNVRTLHIQHGNAAAIYTPNLLRDHIEKMLSQYPIIQKDLMKAYNELCIGQLYESQVSTSFEMNWEDYQKIVELKSAGFGRFALGTGYYLAHDSIDEKNPEEIAKTGAMLFQIVDDIEDLLDSSQDISTDIQNAVNPAPYFFLTREQRDNLSSPRDIQRALSQPEVLGKTYDVAKKYLSKLESQIMSWLPNNPYRENIIRDINARFEERTKTCREVIK